MITITLAAAALRVIPWLANSPLHQDEALYGAWARLIATGRDPLLLGPYVDKPPFALYMMAASFRLLGVSELALRLPGMLAGVALIPITYAAACRLADRRVAWLAATLLAVSPFAIQFAPTAFTDPFLALWLGVALWAALADRAGMCGLALGLAVASKQQGLLALPLIVVILALERQENACQSPSRRRAGWGRGIAAFLAVAAVITWWDSVRWLSRPSFWERSLTTYGWLGLAAPTEWVGRATRWGEQLGYLFGLPMLSAILAAFAALAGVAAVVRRHGNRTGAAHGQRGHLSAAAGLPAGPSRARDRATAVLAGFVAAYLLSLLVVTFQTWDRYLLPILPIVALLAASGLIFAWDWAQRSIRASAAGQAYHWLPAIRGVAVIGMSLTLAWSAGLGAGLRLPVGSANSPFAGLAQAADFLRAQPSHTMVFYSSLGWHLDYYLFGSDLDLVWWDTSGGLARLASAQASRAPERRQWLIMPAWEQGESLQAETSLAGAGLVLALRAVITRPDGSPSFDLYEIMPAQSARRSQDCQEGACAV